MAGLIGGPMVPDVRSSKRYVDLGSIDDAGVALDDIDVQQPIPAVQAQKLLSAIFPSGTVIFSSHARDEMREDNITDQDALNVMRAGRIHAPAEYLDASWRYRVHTELLFVVVPFDSITSVIVVTGWRKK